MRCCPWDASEHILDLRPAVSLVAPGQLTHQVDQTTLCIMATLFTLNTLFS
ncbi:hypothetical protein DOT_2656 [Desulfosporosinus sp. OT]|nr:hypothetical protein DOT_2656 [Desulfosporosinus sp. OT]